MHTRTKTIVDTLNIDSANIKSIYSSDRNLDANAIKNLEDLGIPSTAIEQIKFFEMISTDLEPARTKDEWIAWLLRKTKKSLTAWLKKKQPMKILFKNSDWHIYAESYSKNVLQLHKTCKPYFDEFAAKNINLLIDLTGDEITIKE